MRTISQATLATLVLSGVLGLSAAQAQGFPEAALAIRPTASVSGSVASGDVTRVAEFPRAALPTTVPSASDRAPTERFAQTAAFPQAALPSERSSIVALGVTSRPLPTVSAPHASSPAHATVGTSARRG